MRGMQPMALDDILTRLPYSLGLQFESIYLQRCGATLKRPKEKGGSFAEIVGG